MFSLPRKMNIHIYCFPCALPTVISQKLKHGFVKWKQMEDTGNKQKQNISKNQLLTHERILKFFHIFKRLL